MDEVDHWMWRLFLDDLGDACASVGMQNVPFLSCLDSEESGKALLPLPTPLLYGISPSLLQRQAFWPSRFVKKCGYMLTWQYFIVIVSTYVVAGTCLPLLTLFRVKIWWQL